MSAKHAYVRTLFLLMSAAGLLLLPLAARSQTPVSGWGYNGNGGLGDGTFVDRPLARNALGIADAVAIAGGLDFSAAIVADGTVWCWGRNDEGQLGAGLIGDQSSPVMVSGLTNVVQIATGSEHVIALKSDGTVWAWGDNSFGQLGDGSGLDRLLPVPVMSLPAGIEAIGCGRTHCFAITAAGQLWAWGSNASGELGDGTTTNQLSPVAIGGLPPIEAVDGGAHFGLGHSIALARDGSVWSWGANDEGQLGDGTTTGRLVPASILGTGTAIAIAAGLDHALALRGDGTVLAWGDNTYGQLGVGTFTMSTLPTPVKDEAGIGTLAGIRAISAGTHSLALANDGTLRAWGYNYYGELGDGSTTDRPLPVVVGCLSGATRIAAADYHSLALGTNRCPLAAEGVSCWGYGGNGGIGDASFLDRNRPVPALGLDDALEIAGGSDFSVAIRPGGTVWCWGLGDQGQLGNGTIGDRGVPTQVPGLTGVVRVAAGWKHTLALKSDGTVWAWGANDLGQLGDGLGIDQPSPVIVMSLPPSIVAIGCGRSASFALTSGGDLWAWGGNASGELGDGTTTNRLLPIHVTGVPPLVAVDGGEHFGLGHTIALASDGSVWTWGANDQGQLGDGTTTTRGTPLAVAGVGPAIAVSAGLSQCLALLPAGTVMSWGDNEYGQLGDGTFIDSPVPGFVLDESGMAPLAGITAISAGTHGLALKGDGTLRAWGYNFYGELGDGTNVDRALPVVVGCIVGVTRIAAADYHSMALGANSCTLVSGVVERPQHRTGVRLGALRGMGSAGADLEFEIERDSEVSLSVFDVMGRQVARVLDLRVAAGIHRVRWNGRTEAGGPIPAGIYFVRLATPDGIASGRLTMLGR